MRAAAAVKNLTLVWAFLLVCADGETTTSKIKHHVSYYNVSRTLSSPHHWITNNITGVKTVTYFYQYEVTHIITSAKAGQPIKLTLEYLDVPPGCVDDSLEILEESHLIFEGCNQTTQKTFQSIGSTVWVIFKSNGDRNDYNVGFLLHYESVLASTVEPSKVVQKNTAASSNKNWLLTLLCCVVLCCTCVLHVASCYRLIDFVT